LLKDVSSTCHFFTDSQSREDPAPLAVDQRAKVELVQMDRLKLGRRQFLKVLGVAGVLALPTGFGYEVLHSAEGEDLPTSSPFAMPDETATSKPAVFSPILILINDRAANPFGPYLAEILRAEGLNCFQVARLSAVDGAILQHFDLILLAEGPLDSRQADLLKGYVANGGKLVAMRPDASLASLFGVEQGASSLAEGYLQVEASHPIGEGISAETLQFHGVADHYRPAGAQVVAWLASDANTRTDFPAMALNRYGQGQAALWAFDLARSVAYTRQGNPAWANRKCDEWDGIRAINMFKGWIDLDRLAIPQADEQQRLLANLLAALSQDARPLPRLWYFPGASASMLIATGDYHGNPHPAAQELLTHIERRGGHASLYYSPNPVSIWQRAVKRAALATDGLPWIGNMLTSRIQAPSPALVARWRAQGHEFGLHPYVDEYSVESGLEASWRRYWKEFTGLGYSPVSPTVRTHRIIWTGWVETARFQASHGMRMNLDYYHWGPLFQNSAGEWVFGYLTGSGLPMKFVDEQGQILNIYQQLTELADDHILDLHWGGWAKLSPDDAVEVSRAMLRRSSVDAPSAIVGQFHVDPFNADKMYADRARRFVEGTTDAAVELGIPIWSAQDWLNFTEVRHDANFEDVQWQSQENRLSFRLFSRAASAVELAVMIPTLHGRARLVQIEVDGSPVAHAERKVGGVSHGWVSIGAGTHQFVATYA
jgi:hypothetical protein